MQKMPHITAYCSQYDPNFATNVIAPHKTQVLVCMKSKFFPTLHRDASLNYPMEINLRVGAIGKSAIGWNFSMQHKTSKAPLYEHAAVSVDVEKKSLKPMPVDKEFVEKFSKYCDDVIPRIESPSKPPGENGIFHCQRQAVWSDLDYLNHVNQANYLKHCLDAASLASKNSHHESSFLVKEATFVHKGEVKEEDIMDIYMWQSKTPDVLYFQTEVKSSRAECYSGLLFPEHL